jgi:predicted thioesterase
MLAARFARSFLNLASLIKPGARFRETHTVLLKMTTNRTGKKGDEILCTPDIVESMNELAAKSIAPLIGDSHKIHTLSVTCAHKAPLALGKRFDLTAAVTTVDQTEIEFHVLCLAQGGRPVVGDGTIRLKLFPRYSSSRPLPIDVTHIAARAANAPTTTFTCGSPRKGSRVAIASFSPDRLSDIFSDQRRT